MAKLEALNDLTNLSSSAITVINDNFGKLETAIEKTLSRDGSSPNSMSSDLDLDSNDLINVGGLQANTLTVETATIGGKLFSGSLEWRGAWTTSTTYRKLDLVNISGLVYVCLEAHNSGVFSADLATSKWEIFIQNVVGPQGPAGAPGPMGDYGSGWGSYVHTGASQTLVGGVKVALLNNAGTVLEPQKPVDIATFYNGTTIPGRNGDGLVAGIEFTFTPSSAAASFLSLAIDIGGTVGELYPQEYIIAHGSGIPHKISYTAAAYTLDTWQANGGVVRVLSDGPGVITGVRYVIHRLHKART